MHGEKIVRDNIVYDSMTVYDSISVLPPIIYAVIIF